MAFRFLHMADIHLDTPFSGREALRDTLRDALRDALCEAVETAIRESVHAVLIAGDLFDSENLSYATLRLVREQLGRLTDAGITVLYATGNHDASPALKVLELPSEVVVFSAARPRLAEVRDTFGQTVGIVAGAGYPQAIVRDNLARSFPRRDSRIPTVGLLHTQLYELSGAGTDWAPCSLADLAAADYNYWALGHIHKPQSFQGGRVWYPGCLCGRDYGETGPRGAVLAEIGDDGAVSTQFVPLSGIGWLDVTVTDLREVTDFDTLRERVQHAIVAQMEGLGAARLMVRVQISGPCGLYRRLTDASAQENLDGLAQDLCDRLGALDVTAVARGVTRPIDVREWRGQPHMLSQMLDMLEEAARDDAALDAALSEIPPDVGLYGAHGKTESEKRAYARQLLNDLPQRLCEKMIKEDE
ncbi:MAG: DNA repair exonuclease [Clostridiales bacterium]|nr:DNA repair exonuclease [Clostridiales bacterium]